MKSNRWSNRNRLLSDLRVASASALVFTSGAIALLAATMPAGHVSAKQLDGTVLGALSFSNTPLLRDDGDSEPAISIHQDGTMAMTALSWELFVTNLWSGSFGSTPLYRGAVDSALQLPGKRLVFGGGDADIDLGSTGTLHVTTLIFLTPPTITSSTLGFLPSHAPTGPRPRSNYPAIAPHRSLTKLAPTARGSLQTAHMCGSPTTMRGIAH